MIFPSSSSRTRGANTGLIARRLTRERRSANDLVLRAGREGWLFLDAGLIVLIS